MDLLLNTRLDLSWGCCVGFVTRPSNEHWQDIDRVLRHLKITMNLVLHYQRFPAFLEGYTYATWNTLSDDSKATNEYLILMEKLFLGNLRNKLY